MAMRTRSTLSSVQDRGCATLASMTEGNYSNQVLAVRSAGDPTRRVAQVERHAAGRFSPSVARALTHALLPSSLCRCAPALSTSSPPPSRTTSSTRASRRRDAAPSQTCAASPPRTRCLAPPPPAATARPLRRPRAPPPAQPATAPEQTCRKPRAQQPLTPARPPAPPPPAQEIAAELNIVATVVAVLKVNMLEAEVAGAACRAIWQLTEHPDSLLAAAKHGAPGPPPRPGGLAAPLRAPGEGTWSPGALPIRRAGALDSVLQAIKVHSTNPTVITAACKALRTLADDPQLQARPPRTPRPQRRLLRPPSGPQSPAPPPNRSPAHPRPPCSSAPSASGP